MDQLKEIILYIYEKYGLLLSEDEAKDFIDWFKLNSEILTDENKVDVESRKYLYDKYKERPSYVNEEDLSNMTYLLSLLRKEIKKQEKDK